MSAWPENWYYGGPGPMMAPWSRTFHALTLRHGRERTDAIVGGNDEATNADLAAWRQLGRKVKAA